MSARQAAALNVAAVVVGFVFYYFLAIPLIQEYAYAGVLAVVLLAFGLARTVPAERRLETAALALAFLYTLAAVGKLADQPAVLRLGGAAFLVGAYTLLAKLAARIPAKRTLPAALAAALLAGQLHPGLYPLLTEFRPLWVSPSLGGQEKIPFFTPVAADLDGDGKAEIAAVAGVPVVSQPRHPTDYRFEYRVFGWTPTGFRQIPPARLGLEAGKRLAALIRNEHAAAPPLGTVWSAAPGELPEFTFRPVVDPFKAVAAANPGNMPFAVLGLTLRSIDASHDSWWILQMKFGNPADRPSLSPLGSDREVSYIAGEGDLDSDGRIERLVNNPDRGAFIERRDDRTTVWRSPNSVFRFEGAGAVGRTKNVILAGDKGFMGLDDRRYLGAYAFKDAALQRLWKVFTPGIVNPTLADVDGDGLNEIVAALYGRQQVVVLAKHGVPVAAGAWIITLAALLLPAAARLKRSGGAARLLPLGAGLAAALLMAAAAAGRLASPATTLPGGAPPEPPDAGAKPDPTAARILAEAVRRMEGVERYSFQGETISYIGKRRIPATFSGAVAPGRLRADAAIWGSSFEAYRDGDLLFLRPERWLTEPATVPETLPGLGKALAYLPDLAAKAARLPGTELVARTRCRVYALYPDAEAIRRLVPPVLAPRADLWDSRRIPGNFLIKVWVGETDGLIYQIQTIFDIPLPEATGVRQKTLVKFWNFNSPAVEIKTPETLTTS